MGAFGYYFWRDDSRYASVLAQQNLRGLGLEMGGGFLYVGASDASDHSGVIAASYPIPLLNAVDHKLVVIPSFDFISGGGRNNYYTFAGDIQYSRSFTNWNYGLRGVFGARPYRAGGTTYTLLFEPSINVGSFSIAGTGYFAALADEDSLAFSQTSAPDQSLVSVEPSIQLHPKFSLGASMEWHNPSNKIEKDDWWQLGPTGYLYPTDKVELVFWGGWQIRPGKDVPAVGISGGVEF
jgi:hypothetical protein